MTRFGEHAAWFAFTSDRFDHDSELPPDANAGNRARFDTSFFDEAGAGRRSISLRRRAAL